MKQAIVFEFNNRFLQDTSSSRQEKLSSERKRAGGEFHFNLGVDREIKTKKEKTRDKRKETILGKIERRYECHGGAC